MSDPAQDQNDEQQPFPAWEDHTDLPVGEILRRTRAYYRLSLPDVERGLRIRASQLGALEDGKIDQLPGRAYAIGFVRAYAEYLGLDGDKMVNLFKAQATGGAAARPELTFPVPASESRIPNVYVLGVCGAVLVCLVGILALIGGKGPDRHDIPHPTYDPNALKGVSASSMPLESALLTSIETAAGGRSPSVLVEPQSRIVVHAIDSAWVEIRNAAGKPILSRILKKGDSYMVPDEEGMVMDTGNAGVLQLVVDGQDMPPLGSPGDIRRKISLTPESLKAGGRTIR